MREYQQSWDALPAKEMQADETGAAFFRSRYTLTECWPDGRGILVNSFTGAVDIVSERVAKFVATNRTASLAPAEGVDQMLVDRGYYVESREIEEACARLVARKAKQAALDSDQIKYMFGLTLKCNLTCKYCWQVVEHGNARQRTNLMSDEVVDAAFRYIDQDMAERGKTGAFISLFGGEPLIDRPKFHHLVQEIGEQTRKRGFHLHFTTNGRDLAGFKEEIRKFRPSIQVTIDGAELGAGQPLLMRAGQPLHDLYETMAAVMEAGTGGMFLRFLANTETVSAFVALADQIFADPRFDNDFTLAVAPVQNKTTDIDKAIPPKFQVLSALMAALSDRPYAQRISYVDWRSLNMFDMMRAGHDLLPMPAFYHCEANVDLTCFDQDGLLYACYETIGDPKFAVGRFWPDVSIDREHLAQYRDRSAFSMTECTNCAMSPVCGGGCEVRGHKKNGAYMHPYCDDLHAETSLVLKNWPEVSRLLTGHTQC